MTNRNYEKTRLLVAAMDDEALTLQSTKRGTAINVAAVTMQTTPTARPSQVEIVDWCRSYVSRTLDVPVEKVDPNAEFDALGFDSAAAVALVVDIGEWLNMDLEPAVLFDFPTISAFAEHIAKQ
jgi:acyl carrier protein